VIQSQTIKSNMKALMIRSSASNSKSFKRIKICKLNLLSLKTIQSNLYKRAKKIQFKINMTTYQMDYSN
jgi:hypothetical protein